MVACCRIISWVNHGEWWFHFEVPIVFWSVEPVSQFAAFSFLQAILEKIPDFETFVKANEAKLRDLLPDTERREEEFRRLATANKNLKIFTDRLLQGEEATKIDDSYHWDSWDKPEEDENQSHLSHRLHASLTPAEQACDHHSNSTQAFNDSKKSLNKESASSFSLEEFPQSATYASEQGSPKKAIPSSDTFIPKGSPISPPQSAGPWTSHRKYTPPSTPPTMSRGLGSRVKPSTPPPKIKSHVSTLLPDLPLTKSKSHDEHLSNRIDPNIDSSALRYVGSIIPSSRFSSPIAFPCTLLLLKPLMVA